MAFQQPSNTQIASLKKSILLQGLKKIDRTGGIEPTCRRKQRGYELLIESNDSHQNILHLFLPGAGKELEPPKSFFDGGFYLTARSIVDGISGDDDDIVSGRDIPLEFLPAFSHQALGPVSLDGVSHFSTGQKCCSVIG